MFLGTKFGGSTDSKLSRELTVKVMTHREVSSSSFLVLVTGNVY